MIEEILVLELLFLCLHPSPVNSMFPNHESNYQTSLDETIFNGSIDLLSSDSLLENHQNLFSNQRFYPSSIHPHEEVFLSEKIINLTSLDVDTITTEDFPGKGTYDLISPNNFNILLNNSGIDNNFGVLYDELTGEPITVNQVTEANSSTSIDQFQDIQTSTPIENINNNNFAHITLPIGNLDIFKTFQTSDPFINGTQIISGNLYANTFSVELETWSRKVILGNGNVNFGSGARDILDLSRIFSNSVSFSPANISNGGIAYNPGNGTRIFDAIYLHNYNQLILFEGIDTIRFADRIINLSETPNDPYFNQQWNLHMTGVHNAWRFTKGSDQVLIGIQDSGLGFDNTGNIHPDLKDTNAFLSNIRDDYGSAITSHGTSVQGIIAANSNNGIGMSGINWNSEVFHIDIIATDGEGLDLAVATQDMINFAAQQGKNLVINMSISFAVNSPLFIDFAAIVASNPNVLFVVSSGNESQNQISAPAILADKYNNVMAIGASWGIRDTNGNPTIPGQRIFYPGLWGSNYGVGLTLMGPSEVIAPIGIDQGNGVTLFGIDDRFNGTSASAPNVTGIASLVWSVNPNLSAAQVRQILSETAYDLGNVGYDYEYGHGLVNADASVRRALAIKLGYV